MVRNVQFAAVIATKRAELMDMVSESLFIHQSGAQPVTHSASPANTALFCSDPELSEIISERKPIRNNIGLKFIRKQSPLIPVQTFQGLEARLALMPVAY